MGYEPPIAYSELRALFEHLDRVSSKGYKCDHLFTQTAHFLGARGLPAELMLAWLGENGAGCDCEVMFNVAQQWEERVGYVPEE
jgi:hypothetical protein